MNVSNLSYSFNPEQFKIDTALSNQTYYEFVKNNCFSVEHNFTYALIGLGVCAIILFLYSHSKYFKRQTYFYTVLYPMITFFTLMNFFVYIYLLFIILG